MARWSKLGVIAGGGALPLRIAEACQMRGAPFHVIRLAGAAEAALSDLPGDDCAIGEVGKIFRTLKNTGCDAVVFAGVVTRPDFSKVKVDWRGAAVLPKILSAATRGDGEILATLVETFEAEGLIVVGAEEVTGDLAASAGPLGARTPSPTEFEDIKKAAAVINALGAFDVGQAAVVSNGLVLAVEAAEGTDAMLERCALLPATVRGAGGVLVKRPKPHQERRVDLPTIGPKTIDRLHKAGLSGVAVEAGASLVIDRDQTVEQADLYGLFVYGFDEVDLLKL